MTLGLCCSQPACRPHPASLPVRVPTVEGLLRASFGCYTLRFATVAVIGSGWLLSSNEILPMLGTLGRTPGPRPTPPSAGAECASSGSRGIRADQGVRPTGLLDGDAFGQVAGLIDIAAAADGYV